MILSRDFTLNKVRQLKLTLYDVLVLFTQAHLKNLAKSLQIPVGSGSKSELIANIRKYRGRISRDAEVTITLNF